jgi:hypothetical protein
MPCSTAQFVVAMGVSGRSQATGHERAILSTKESPLNPSMVSTIPV